MEPMRILAGLLVVAAGCAPDAAGILLTVVPMDPEVMTADTLEVYVGFGDSEEDPLASPPVRVHIDDGHAGIFDIGTFAEPVDVLLDGRPMDTPFYVAVRAVAGDQLVGEGGVVTPLTLISGKLLSATADIALPRGHSAPNCPGFDDGQQWHYLVGPLRDDDCDADGEIKDNPDCDDFDKSFNTGVIDMTCDTLDHSCGAHAPLTTTVPCVGSEASGGRCFLGERSCVDGTPPQPTCTVNSAIPVPDAVCTECADAMTAADLSDCLGGVTTVQASCNVDHTASAFCLPTGLPDIGLTSERTWWDFTGGAGMEAGFARWLDLPPRVTGLAFKWASEGQGIIVDATTYPPSPAIEWADGLLPLDLQLRRYAVVRDSAANTSIMRVDFDIQEVAGCQPTTQPSCQNFPASN